MVVVKQPQHQQQPASQQRKVRFSWKKRDYPPPPFSSAILQYSRSDPNDLFVTERLLQHILVFELHENG
jgi:hypothetical protein